MRLFVRHDMFFLYQCKCLRLCLAQTPPPAEGNSGTCSAPWFEHSVIPAEPLVSREKSPLWAFHIFSAQLAARWLQSSRMECVVNLDEM